MSTIACLSRDRLREFLEGILPEQDSATIVSHLETCATCEATVAELDAKEDTLVGLLRSKPCSVPAEETPVEPSAYRLAVKKLKSMSLTELGSAGRADERAERILPAMIRDYELLECLGRGGMGAVYKARHSRLCRMVALKTLPARLLGDSHVARFQREMQAVGQLQHPAIVQATDGGEVEQVHYLVMELVDGVDLKTVIDRLGPLPVGAACELARQAALGLAHAHEHGVIHRDVKPSNLMLSVSGQCKILDLGLARVAGEPAADELTTVGQLMGTVDYMAPEQFENSHEVDERADVYGLGATLFKLLRGHAPHAGQANERPLVRLRRIATTPAPSLVGEDAGVPEELARLVDSMLERDLSARPNSMTEVATRLATWSDARLLEGLAVQSRDAGPPNRTPPLSRADSLSSNIKSVTAPEPVVVRKQQGTWWRVRRRLLVALGLVAILLCGVLITLELTSGTLVIETAIPDVEVRILKAGKAYQELTLHQTAESVRLGAGDYEVQLNGLHDGLVVTNSTFTLRRGETAVARITRQVPGTLTPAEPSISAQPLFEGRRLSQWLEQLQSERKPEAILNGMEAVARLCPADRRTEFATLLINRVATMEERDIDTALGNSNEMRNETVGRRAAAIIHLLPNPAVVEAGAFILERGSPSAKRFVCSELAAQLSLVPPDDQSALVPANGRFVEQLIRLADSEFSREQLAAIDRLAKIYRDSSGSVLLAAFFDRQIRQEDHERSLTVFEVDAPTWVPERDVPRLRQVIVAGTPPQKFRAFLVLVRYRDAALPALPEILALWKDPQVRQMTVRELRLSEKAMSAISVRWELKPYSSFLVVCCRWLTLLGSKAGPVALSMLEEELAALQLLEPQEQRTFIHAEEKRAVEIAIRALRPTP